MATTREQIENALCMYLDDYVEVEDDVKKGEMVEIKKHFDKMYGQLELEASPDTEEGEEE